MLTVDLKNADDKRKTFNEKMASLNWTKLKKLTTIWTVNFKECTSEAEALGISKADVKTAADEAKIKSYDVAVHFGANVPYEYSV